MNEWHCSEKNYLKSAFELGQKLNRKGNRKMYIESVTEKERIAALIRLLKESADQLEWIVREYPRVATSDISSVLERARIAIADRT